MQDRVIKVTRRGGVLLDGERTELEQLSAALAVAREEGRRAVYYREGAMSDPEPAVMDVVKVIRDSRVQLSTGEDVISEWGPLGAFALYHAPKRFRLSVTRAGQFQLHVGAQGETPARSVEVELPQNERIMHQLDMLVRSDRILESPEHESEHAFNEERVEKPSLHLRVEYLDRGPWISYYALPEVPAQVRSLVEDCEALGRHILGDG